MYLFSPSLQMIFNVMFSCLETNRPFILEPEVPGIEECILKQVFFIQMRYIFH